MAKNKKSFRDELEKLAKISNDIDSSILSKGDVNIIIELNEKDYKEIIKNFADIYRLNEEFLIEISDVKFTFVLKK